MKKTLLFLGALSAASLSFAGGQACADKEKCDAKCDKACCKSDKDCKAACTEKTEGKKDAASSTEKSEKK